MTRLEKLGFIGDIHGDSEGLTKLLSRLGDSDRRLVFLGDYVDKGPSSRSVLEVLIKLSGQKPAPVFLSGNHEIGLLAFLSARLSFLEYAWMGGLPTIQSYLGRANQNVVEELVAEFPASHLKFLTSCKRYFENDRLLASHAGVNPACPLSRDLAEVVLARHKALFDPVNQPSKLVICGHYSQATNQPFISSNLICLNTKGGNTGGPVSALLYPEMAIVQA